MASKGSLFNAIKSIPSRDIIRYHATDIDNVPSILEKGLQARSGGGMSTFAKQKGVFTSANPTWDGDVDLVLSIPKDKYRNMPRWRENLELSEKDNDVHSVPGSWRDKEEQRELGIIGRGGRTDIFENDIPPEYISKICQRGECYPVDEWLEMNKNKKLVVDVSSDDDEWIPWERREYNKWLAETGYEDSYQLFLKWCDMTGN